MLREQVTMRDPVLDATLQREGYVVVDLLDPEQIETLDALTAELHGVPKTGWESDFYSPDPDLKRRVHHELAEAFAPGVSRHFVDHRTLLHNFVINWPGTDGGLVLHQHSSLVDERHFRSVIAWCAITSASEANGTLHVVPRSHLIQRGPRPERSASWCEPHIDLLLRDHLVSVPVEPGQALVFDNNLLHCSFPNQTDSARVTAAAAVIPSQAEPLFFEAIGTSRVRIHRLDPTFFLQHQAGDLEWASPEDLEVLSEEDWTPSSISAGELAATLSKGTCAHAR